MKSFLRLGLIFATSVAFAQDYNGTTVPKTNDNEKDSLKKVDKVLNDSKTNVSPLNITVLLSPLTQPASGTGDFNGTTVPKTNDAEKDSLRKINKLLNDSKTGVSPLNVLGAGGSGSMTINGTAGQVTVNTVGTTSTISIPSTLVLGPTPGSGTLAGTAGANGTLSIEGTTNATKTTSSVNIQTAAGNIVMGGGNGTLTVFQNTINTSSAAFNLQTDSFQVQGNSNYADTLISIDTATGVFGFGDINNIGGNGTAILVDAGNNLISLNGPAQANQSLMVNGDFFAGSNQLITVTPLLGFVGLGDHLGAGNNTAIVIDNAVGNIQVTCPVGGMLISGNLSVSNGNITTLGSGYFQTTAGLYKVGTGGNTAQVKENRAPFSSMSLRRTIASITGVSSGISGVTYNARSNTLFLVRNVTAAAGTIYEVTLDGTLLRTINNSNFIDTEAIEWVGSIRGAGTNTLYDVFLVGEEDHTTAANESQITLCLLTTGATSLDRTATNGTDPDNVTVTTAYSGGSIANSGLEALCYDSMRSRVYYTSEFANGATYNSTGSTQAHILQRDITWNASTLSFGSESIQANIMGVFDGVVLGPGGDISDMSYSVQDDTIILQSDVGDRAVKITLDGITVLETLTTTAGQPEGGCISPDGKTYWVVGEAQEFYRYAIGPDQPFTRILTQTATLDFASTAAAAVADLTITVTDAAIGDPVVVSPLSAPTATATLWAWVSAANTVTVRFSPKATEDPASATYRVNVFKN